MEWKNNSFFLLQNPYMLIVRNFGEYRPITPPKIEN